MFGEWTTRVERATEHDREEALTARGLAVLAADQHPTHDPEGQHP